MKKLFHENVLFHNYVTANLAVISGILLMAAGILVQRVGLIPTIPCYMLALLHIYCPGCGGTRAFFALIHGHILQSIYYNPVVVLLLILILYYEISVGVTIYRERENATFKGSGKPVYAFVIFMTIYTIVRNVLLCHFGIDMLGDVL